MGNQSKKELLVESVSGIRGIWGTGLDKKSITSYARAYLEYTKAQKIIIGRDSRVSGEEIFAIWQDICKDKGIEILDVGILPTPLVQMAVRNNQCNGGVIITASHNPAEYNGMKLLRSDGGVLFADQMNVVIKNVHDSPVETRLIASPPQPIASLPRENTIISIHNKTITEYIDFLKSLLHNNDFSKYTIFIDSNGSAATQCIQKIAKAFDLNIIQRTNETYGDFWRPIEPKKNTIQNVTQFFTKDTDFAACFDCDADRVEFVLPNKQIISGQQIFALIAKSFLSQSPQKYIVMNDATSGIVREIAKHYKVHIIDVEVGEANVVEAMQKHTTPIGGEGSSGGVIIAQNRCRDGILSLFLILDFLESANTSLPKAMTNLPYYSTDVEVLQNIDAHQMRNVWTKYAQKNHLHTSKTGDTNGGYKIHFDENSFAWFRPSKTEIGVIRVIFDTNKKMFFKNIKPFLLNFN